VCPPEAIFTEEDLLEKHKADMARDTAYFTNGPGYWEYHLDEERLQH